MAQKGQASTPAMSDAAVKAKTGKTWAEWFAALDEAKAQTLSHTEIVALVKGVAPWWRQMVTVEYERAQGLRIRHQTASGFSVSVSKTLGVDVSALYGAAIDAKMRKKWFPAGAFQPSSATANKYFRGSWNGPARLEINFYAKGDNKAQINVQVNRLGSNDDVERQRAAWKSALDRLRTVLGA